MRTFSFNFCMFAVFSLPLFLDLLTQITALSHPDFIIERSQSDSDTQCHCWNQLAPVLRFPLSVPPGHPCGQVEPFFLSPVSLRERVLGGKQGNPVVGALVWESDNLSTGP